MAKLYKIVVTGPFNAGKTTFVKTLSEIDPVNTDRKTTRPEEAQVKLTTTVAMDYGRVKLARGITIRLFGTPGQERFDFMHQLLSEGMQGFIFLIDASDPQGLNQAARLFSRFNGPAQVPYLLVANKADQKSMSLEEIRKQLKLSPDQPLVACVATDKASVRSVVEQLITLIEAGN
jgi:small GTP-binding protein